LPLSIDSRHWWPLVVLSLRVVATMVSRLLLVAAVLCHLASVATGFRATRGSATSHQRWLRRTVSMSTTEAPPKTSVASSDGKKPSAKASGKKVLTAEQFGKYVVGQKYYGRVVSSKQFGCFVDIGETSILLPRSVLTRGNFEKLTNMATTKSAQQVEVELIGVSALNQTLSARYVPANAAELKDISTLAGTDFKGTQYPGTVVSVHDFGVFVELDQFGVEGLVPQSMLPRGESKPKAGASVVVNIQDLGVDGKKLLLSMRSSGGGSAQGGLSASAFASIPHTRWIQGVVQSVTNFGFFVRPAGFDSTGLVHNSRVPRDLVSALKRRPDAGSSSSGNKTDVEMLFGVGDVVKVRVNSVNSDSNRVELSMLPYRAADDEEDDYVVEGRDPETEDGKPSFQDRGDADEEDAADNYDAEDTLLWWRGSPYVKSSLSGEGASVADEEAEVVMENTAVVEGTWRRMFELDMREDQADFSTKVKEADLKELEEEIGELSGLDEDLLEAELSAASIISSGQKLVNYVSLAGLPAAWKSEMGFLKGSAEAETTKVTTLRQGKTLEQSEFEALLREVEVELDEAAKRGGRSDAAAAVVASGSAAAEAEPAALTEGA